jgi:hypothetical protein
LWKGPFGVIPKSEFAPGEQWTGLKFSANDRDVLVTTRQEKLYLVDSQSYRVRHALTDYSNKTEMAIEASFSPDGQFVVGGRTVNGGIIFICLFFNSLSFS